MKNFTIINPIDWGIIQFQTGLDINSQYESIEDAFRVILKQYILYFNITHISSRDKRQLLDKFLKEYEDFLLLKPEINKILNGYLTHKPSDDLIFHLMEIAIYRFLKSQDNFIDLYKTFIDHYDTQYKNLFITVMNKFLDNHKLQNI